MTEEELDAEALLMALAHPLAWHYIAPNAATAVSASGAQYHVHPSFTQPGKFRIVFVSPLLNISEPEQERFCDSFLDGQKACFKHNAEGKWPSEP